MIIMEEQKVKILIGCPTGDVHSYVIDEFLGNISKFTYPKFDLMLVDNSKDLNFYNKLKEFKLPQGKVIIEHMEFEDTIFKTVAVGYNRIISYMLKNGYDYYLILSTDEIPPVDTIERLLSHNKDIVGFIVHFGLEPNTIPNVMKDGNFITSGKRGLHWYNWKEIEKMKGLTKVWGITPACLLVKRKVFKTGVRFRYYSSWNVGEDVWFIVECNSNGFEFWLDPIRVTHKNISWTDKGYMKSYNNVMKTQVKNITKIELNQRIATLEIKFAHLIRMLKERKMIE